MSEKERRPDIDAIYEQIMKSEASNADKNLIETIKVKLQNKTLLLIRRHVMD